MLNFQLTIERFTGNQKSTSTNIPHLLFQRNPKFPNESNPLFKLWSDLASAFGRIKIFLSFAAMQCGYRDHCAIVTSHFQARRISSHDGNEWIKMYENRGYCFLLSNSLKKNRQKFIGMIGTGLKAFRGRFHTLRRYWIGGLDKRFFLESRAASKSQNLSRICPANQENSEVFPWLQLEMKLSTQVMKKNRDELLEGFWASRFSTINQTYQRSICIGFPLHNDHFE